MKLLTAMFLVLCACGGGGSKKETASGKGKKEKSEVTKVEDGEGGGDADGGDGDEGETKGKKFGKKGGKGGSWGSGKARTCLDETRLPTEGVKWTGMAAAMEKDVLRICKEAHLEGDDVSRACVGLDPETGRGSRATIKPLAAVNGEIWAGKLKTGEEEKREACSAEDKCKTLGKKAGVAVMAAVQQGEEGEARQVSVTADGALLAISGGGGYQVWNVAKDKAVKLKAPKSVTKEYLETPAVTVLGSELFLQWNPCAGPCSVARRFDAKGKAVGKDLVTEDKPHYFDDARWTILAGDLLVFDTKSGKQQHAIKLFPDFPKYTVDGTTYQFPNDIITPTMSVPLGDGRVALLFDQEPVIAIANLDEGKLLSLYRTPLCDDEDADKDEEALKTEEKESPEEAPAEEKSDKKAEKKPSKSSKKSK